MVATGLDVLVVPIGPIAIAAKDVTKTIPIVVVSVGDPVAIGLVSSLARPEGNLTGLTMNSLEISGKRLALLEELMPRLARIAVLKNSNLRLDADVWQETKAVAKTLGVALQPLDVHDTDDFEPAFVAASQQKAEAILVFDDPLTFNIRERMVDLAAKCRLPSMYGFREFPDNGGLMSHGANAEDLWRRSASFVDRILKGARPGDLPFE
jgi:putative ABC transport system substrate-binding protein